MFKGIQETKRKKYIYIHGYDSIHSDAKQKERIPKICCYIKKRQTQGQLRQHGFQPNSHNPTNQPRQGPAFSGQVFGKKWKKTSELVIKTKTQRRSSKRIYIFLVKKM